MLLRNDDLLYTPKVYNSVKKRYNSDKKCVKLIIFSGKLSEILQIG